MILIIIYSIYNLFLILQKFDLRNLTIIQSHHHRITRLTVHHRIAQYRLTAKEFRSGWDKLKTSVRAPKIEGRTRQKGGGEKKKGKRKKKKKESSSLRAQRTKGRKWKVGGMEPVLRRRWMELRGGCPSTNARRRKIKE